MALIKCPECGHEVSDQAETCPNCGYALKSNAEPQPQNQSISSADSTQSSNSKAEGQPTSDQEETIIANQDTPVQQEQPPAPKRPVSKRRIITGILCAVAVVIILIVVLTQVLLSADEKQAVAQMQSDITAIGTVTIDSGDDIKHAEDEYATLSNKCKRHVNNYADLEAARSDYDSLLAKNAEDKIAKLKNITSDSEQDIQDAEEAFAALTDTQKGLVTNADLLEGADQRLIEAKAAVIEEKIDNIGELQADGTTGTKLKKIRHEYENLDNDVKAAVKNINKLDEAEKAYSDLKVQNVINLIDGIGEVSLKNGLEVVKAETAYRQLEDDEKSKVTNAEILEKDWKTYSKLKAEQDKKDREAAENAKKLKTGDVIKTDTWELTLKSVKITDGIYPNDTSGYYLYYPADDGSVYIDLAFTCKNISNTMEGLDYIFDNYSIEYGGTVYNKNFTLFGSVGRQIEQVYSWDGLDSLDTCTLHLTTQLPSEAKNNDKSIVVNVDIDGITKRCIVKK